MVKISNGMPHGMMKLYRREYRSWYGMIRRCTDEIDNTWKYYGGRGIIVCDRWLNCFGNFLDDMGICPPGLTLDRIDNNGNYELSNCRWATRKQQADNRGPFRVKNLTKRPPRVYKPMKEGYCRISKNGDVFMVVNGKEHRVDVKDTVLQTLAVGTYSADEIDALLAR